MTRSEFAVVFIHILAITVIIALAGCSPGSIDPGQIRKPDAALMLPAPPLPAVKAGDDLRVRYAELRRGYGRETGRLRHLQQYVRTVTGP